MNLQKIKSIHFVGIKGVAMTALAIVAYEMGIKVSGSDIDKEFPTDITLKRFKIKYQTKFSAENIKQGVDLVIYTGAHQGVNNIEVQAALSKKIPVMPHGKALGLFMQNKKGISIAGSHGKTTTSAMIAHILMTLKKDPSFAIGCGEILSLKASGHFGTGDYFVAEADEYVTDPTSDATPRFMWQHPYVLVITNIDFDHPDVYKNVEEVKKAFRNFINQVKTNGFVVVNADDNLVSSIAKKTKIKMITYGKNEKAHCKLLEIKHKEGTTDFKVELHGKIEKFTLSIPGEHNAQNAAAVIATLSTLGFSLEQVRQGLATFTGTKRRFEFVGKKNGKLLYDDYAHHPTEIKATLKATREWFPKKRILVVFQAHTYSRTQSLLGEFAKALNFADEVLITDIYASSREKSITGLSGKTIVDEVMFYKKNVLYTPKKADVLEYLQFHSKPNDLILTMGAGDIFSWLPEIFEVL